MSALITQLLQKTASRAKTTAAPKVERPSNEAQPFEQELKKVQEKEPKVKTESAAPAKKATKAKQMPDEATEPADEAVEAEGTESKQAAPVEETEDAGEVEAPVAEGEAPVEEGNAGETAEIANVDMALMICAPVQVQQATVEVREGEAGETDADGAKAQVNQLIESAMTTGQTTEDASEETTEAPTAPMQQDREAILRAAGLLPENEVAATPNKPVVEEMPSVAEKAPEERQGAIKLEDVTDAPAAASELPEVPVIPTLEDALKPTHVASKVETPELTASVSNLQTPNHPHATHQTNAPVAPQPEVHFAELNHPNIVTGVKQAMLPQGGTMQIRLDPPEMGALLVSVTMRDGTLTASFQTSNEDATRLLSHSMTQLKAALETQGVHVEKLQVEQAPRNQQAQNDDPQRQQQGGQDANSAWQEQQRKQMLQRMWRRIAMGADPLDLVA